VRDTVDLRLSRDIRNLTGAIINSQDDVGGWPALNSLPAPLDTDQDGIPNYWESAMGWNPAVANNNHTNYDGYTDLEWYLNWLAAPRALCDRNGSVDVDLVEAAGGATNLSFSLSAGTNGTVTLLGDGRTARFVATNNYSGLAGFAFTASDAGIGSLFGPNPVGVLVTTTNAPNSPPQLVPISDAELLAGATLTFTNKATDAEAPPQSLSFSLLDPPTGAAVGTSSGVFSWRPGLAQAGTSNTMRVVVTDSGSPALSATQAFSVVVSIPAQPALQSGFSNGVFTLLVNGDAGPDYAVLASTNLLDWITLTNAVSPALPFLWSDPAAASFERRFFRVSLGP